MGSLNGDCQQIVAEFVGDDPAIIPLRGTSWAWHNAMAAAVHHLGLWAALTAGDPASARASVNTCIAIMNPEHVTTLTEHNAVAAARAACAFAQLKSSTAATTTAVDFSPFPQLHRVERLAQASWIHGLVLPKSTSSFAMAACQTRTRLKLLDLSRCLDLNIVPPRCFHHAKIDTVILPTNVKELDDAAFCGCELGVLDLSACEQLTEIRSNCFSESRFVSVRLPASLRSLGDRAFSKSVVEKSVDLSACIYLRQLPFEVFADLVSETTLLPHTMTSIDSRAFFRAKLRHLDLSVCGWPVALHEYSFDELSATSMKLPRQIVVGGAQVPRMFYSMSIQNTVNFSSTSVIVRD